tara:strand:+ start:226 stop:609 length:384 start_codon:yes stop_codon:yes gene_type:complete
MSGAGGGLISGPMVHAPLQFRLAPGGRSAGSTCFLLCPRCDAPAFIRRSERKTEQVTQMECHCTDTACGHTYRADIVFVHSICAGNFSRPDLDLPVCPRDQVTHVRPPGRDANEDEPTFFDKKSATG